MQVKVQKEQMKKDAVIDKLMFQTLEPLDEIGIAHKCC